jgi:hypothetical protein
MVVKRNGNWTWHEENNEKIEEECSALNGIKLSKCCYEPQDSKRKIKKRIEK